MKVHVRVYRLSKVLMNNLHDLLLGKTFVDLLDNASQRIFFGLGALPTGLGAL